ncbi:MAG TPA: hypothetical protein VFQ77_14410 [Pseudonocardiaceae bacterium]|nr:hypothetical protein [Pseudonocardiaceae bacterium]
MTIQVNVQEAKTRLSQILAQAEAGEDVVLARDPGPAGSQTRYDEGRVRADLVQLVILLPAGW